MEKELKVTPAQFLFNRGIVSKFALARVTEADQAANRIRLSAEEQTNWMPRVLGSMMLRPGLKYTGATASNNKAVFLPFVKATDDTADIELTDSTLRVWVDDAVISRPSVTASITNGNFNTDVTGWTDADETGAASSWQAGGYMALLGTGFNSAKRRQQVTVTETDTLHGLRVTIERGPVDILVGSSSGGEDYFRETLGTGVHSLAFTPTGNFWIEFQSAKNYTVLVNSVSIESSGNQSLPAPWVEDDLSLVRWEQSGDVIFVACHGYQQRRIERRGTTSWSIVLYEPEDGPFRAPNFSKTTLTPSAVSGDITLTASNPVFKSGNVGSLYRIGSIGQYVEHDATGEDQWTDAISVSGVDATRKITINVAGTWSGTVTLQRSADEGATWAEVATYTANQTNLSYDDGLDNQDLQYRIGIATGDYSSGTAELSLTYATGSLTGIARVTAVTGPTTASAVVLKSFGGTDGSSDWAESEWSARRGYPTAIAIYEGRMSWFGRGKSQFSESDAYNDFDSTVDGDAGPINKTIGFGAVDFVNWAFSGPRLLIGADGSEIVTRQSFDEIITPANSGFAPSSRIGSSRTNNAVIDDMPVFIQRCGTKLYRMLYDAVSYKYQAADLMELAPELGEPSLTRVAVQRQPDTRIHAVRSDGKVVIRLFEPSEEASALILFETDGFVEDIYVQPGDIEDKVYYIVRRTVNGSTVRYREQWALEKHCQGGTLNKQADSFISYEGVSTATITGIDHLEGESVVAWGGGAEIGSYAVSDGQITGLTDYIAKSLIVRNAADDDDYGLFEVNEDGAIDGLSALDGNSVKVRQPGKDLGSYTVSSGQITLSEAVTEAVVGLKYRARYRSVKLAYGAQSGTALTQVKRIDHIAPVLTNTHYQGLKYGRNFSNLFDLPDTYRNRTVANDEVFATYDQAPFGFDGEFTTDARLCLQAEAPRPCTVLGVVFSIQTNEKG